jgi:uncharacterized membrane protein YqjE
MKTLILFALTVMSLVLFVASGIATAVRYFMADSTTASLILFGVSAVLLPLFFILTMRAAKRESFHENTR